MTFKVSTMSDDSDKIAWNSCRRVALGLFNDSFCEDDVCYSKKAEMRRNAR